MVKILARARAENLKSAQTGAARKLQRRELLPPEPMLTTHFQKRNQRERIADLIFV
jgi:hypothetical protein